MLDAHTLHTEHICQIYKSQTLHGTAIHTYIDPVNHPNVGIYGAYMECLGIGELLI